MTKPLLGIRHLQMISTIAKTGRVTNAAEELGLTPSALSHRINEAERRLGVKLFERRHKRLRMTEAAEYLAQVSERLIRELELVEADVQKMSSGVEHVVRITIEAYSSYHWLPNFLEFFSAHSKGIEIQVMTAVDTDPLVALKNRHVDLAIVSGNLTKPNTKEILLFRDPLMFITHPAHSLAAKKYVAAKDLENEAFITYTKIPEPDREFAQLFRLEGYYPRWKATVEVPEAIVELVAAGQGTSVLAGWAIKPHVINGRIAAMKVSKDGILIPWNAVFRDDENSNSPVIKTAELLKKWCKTTYGGF